MKSANIFFDRSYGYARAITTLIGGLILVIWPDVIQKWIVYIIGVLILAVGITSIMMSHSGKWATKEKMPLLTLSSIFDIAFGLVLLIFPNFFAGLMFFVFGLLLLIFGLGEVINLIRLRKSVSVPYEFYIGPGIITTVGILMFFFPNKSGNWIFILFGATLILYAISEFASTFMIKKKTEGMDISPAEEGVVEDVEAEEVE